MIRASRAGGQMRQRISLAGAALAALAVFGYEPSTAQAYPQWQFSSETSRCAQCHYSPSGGGIITGYARDAVGEDLSTFEGDGAFMHGAIDLPKAVALQFDGRYSVMAHDVGEKRGGRLLHFPMQADLSGRFGLSDAVSLVATVGYRGQARASNQTLGVGAAQPAGGSLFISREHYLMWRPEAMGAYVRVGRFFAPFGLRLAEHYTYVRRDSGYNLLEESYNLSGGWVESTWELHLTAFGPDFLRGIGADETGGTALYEQRVGDASALGLSVRAATRSDRNRYTGGVFGKTYFESAKTLFQTELNLTHNIYGKVAAQSFTAYAGLTFFPGTGLWLTPFVERSQTSIAVRNSAMNAGGAQINWFPYPHFEVVLLGRAQIPAAKASSTTSKTAMTGMAFLHYYL